MTSKGYVAIFDAPLDKKTLSEFVVTWIERFEKVEQLIPNGTTSLCAISIAKVEEVIWEPHLQFRVTNGEEFTWVYVSLDRKAIETSGFESEKISLSLDVLLELDGVVEIVEDKNERRLDELEAQGLL